MSPSPVVLTDVTAETSADTTKKCHRVNVLYNTQGSSEIHLSHWNPRLAVPEIFNLHSCPASVFCIVQPCIPARGKCPHKTAYTHTHKSLRKQDVVRMSAPVGSEAVGVLKVLMMAQHFTFSFSILNKTPGHLCTLD